MTMTADATLGDGRSQAETDAALALQRTLTQTERLAIVEYAGPRLRGAQVADILSIACDNDANLGITEPFFDEHVDALTAALGTDDVDEGYPRYLRAFIAAFSVQAVAILTRKVPGREHVISLATDALKVATGEVTATVEDDATALALMERRRTPHGHVGAGITCDHCGLADGAAVHRDPSPASDG